VIKKNSQINESGAVFYLFSNFHLMLLMPTNENQIQLLLTASVKLLNSYIQRLTIQTYNKDFI